MDSPATPLLSSLKKVVIAGVGGIGCHLVKKIRRDVGADLKAVLINTDERSFGKDSTIVEISLKTGGRGTGSRSAQGAALAEQRIRVIEAGIGDADLVIIIAALGGGTGSGATPAVIRAATVAGAIPILVVLTPSASDSPRRRENAREALQKITALTSTLIMHQMEVPKGCPASDELESNGHGDLKAVEQWIALVVRDLLAPLGDNCGPISAYDAADLEFWLRQKGQVRWASATATGTNRTATACTEVLYSLRKESRENGRARATLCVISAHEAPRVTDVKTALDMVRASCGPDGVLIFYAAMDERLADESIRVTVISKAPRRRDVLTVVHGPT